MKDVKFQKQVMKGIKQELIIDQNLKEGSEFQKNEIDVTKLRVHQKFIRLFKLRQTLEEDRFTQ